MTFAIQVNQLVKQYPKLTALNQVNFEVKQGEFFGLLGPNGAGKTTLISILAGLARATSGTAQVMGFDVQKDYQQARRTLGVVPQELSFDPFFTVRETLQWQSGYFGIKNNRAWIDELLEHLGLTDKADVNMRALSGGMKRRVLVAQALVHRPKVIILDEPTAGVDVELRQSLWTFISRLHREGHTIVLTTHYLEEAEQLCERIAILKKGELVALDRTSTLLQQLAGVRLVVKTHNELNLAALPVEIQAMNTQNANKRHSFTLKNANQVEQVLASVRMAGGELEDVLVSQADLEDVFVKLVNTTVDTNPVEEK
ncbi:MAG: ABC transporter ATP-binding protein [Burkholderiales bacterium]|nr:ABC transporter ATP-binding protein [Burkholderiales bacterium]